MNCYVCETPVMNCESSVLVKEKYFCCPECVESCSLLSNLATAIESKERKPRLTAYSDMSLFEPVDLGKMHDDDDEPTEEKYVLPVVIEALPAWENETLFFVKVNNGKRRFAPGKQNALKFYDVSEAKKYIAEELKPEYAESFNFILWSESALV